MPESSLLAPLLRWYDDHKRVLPWREPTVGGWEVMVSEVMLQQTPVARVLPAYEAWIARWPTPAGLAADTPGDAVRMWGRLGYPRRALRLHAAATTIDAVHDGVVPSAYDELRALPGIGDYTAAAVSAFAYRQRQLVLDTNVRRVLSRVLTAQEYPSTHLTRGERERAASVLPDDPEVSACWNIAVMELGALVCSARTPRCSACPLQRQCSWFAAGRPPHEGPPRRGQDYPGTDRQCRGRILSALREAEGPVPAATVDATWNDPEQRERALASLLDDGLVVRLDQGAFGLP
ncbi:MAG: A/G-specific adenine glycosylase [Nocardioidaceae bacterium]